MTEQELRQTLADALTQLARDIYNTEAEIKRLRQSRHDLKREMDRQQGAVAALDLLGEPEEQGQPES